RNSESRWAEAMTAVPMTQTIASVSTVGVAKRRVNEFIPALLIMFIRSGARRLLGRHLAEKSCVTPRSASAVRIAWRWDRAGAALFQFTIRAQPPLWDRKRRTITPSEFRGVSVSLRNVQVVQRERALWLW